MTDRRPIIVALAWALLALAIAGCSHGPKPKAASAEPAHSPPPPFVSQSGPPAGATSEDTLTTKKTTRPKGTGPSVAKTPAPAPDPGATARSGGSSSAPAVPDTIAMLEPALSPEEKAKLEEKTRTTIEAARTKLESVEAARLDAERLRKYRLANDYLAEAMRARDGKDLQRASSLALKAKLLAEEL